MARIKIELPEKIIASVEIRVRITDINYGNHVGNDSFVAYIHEARMQWLHQNHYTELEVAGVGLIMSDLAIEFRQECFYGEQLLISIRAGEIGKAGFELFYLVETTRKDKTVLLAKAKTGMVCFDYQLKKVTTVPLPLHDLLAG